jgi:hypothetical protein
MENKLVINGVVVEGHAVASGQSTISPYKGGSLRMQLPFFQKLNIPLEDFYLGTINVDISPKAMELVSWDYEARQTA